MDLWLGGQQHADGNLSKGLKIIKMSFTSWQVFAQNFFPFVCTKDCERANSPRVERCYYFVFVFLSLDKRLHCKNKDVQNISQLFSLSLSVLPGVTQEESHPSHSEHSSSLSFSLSLTLSPPFTAGTFDALSTVAAFMTDTWHLPEN